MHGRQTSYTNRAFNSLQFGVFYGIFERTVDFLRFFFGGTKAVWTRIHAYGGEWVKSPIVQMYKEGEIYCASIFLFKLATAIPSRKKVVPI